MPKTLKVHSIDGKKVYWDDGKKWNLCPPEDALVRLHEALKEDATVIVGFEKNDKYWNVKSVEYDGGSSPEPSPEPMRANSSPPKDQSSTREGSIELQVAIKEIGECWRVARLEDDDPRVQAYLNWLSIKVQNYSSIGTPPEITEPVADKTSPMNDMQRELIKTLVVDRGLTAGKVKTMIQKINKDKSLTKELTMFEAGALINDLNAIPLKEDIPF